MKHTLRAVGLALLAATVAACVETRFAAPPGDNIETCDPHWKGLWAEPASKGETTDASAIFVDDECRFIVLDQPEKRGPLKQIHVPMNYVHAGGKDYLVVADTSLKGLVDLKPPHGIDPPPEKSYYYARYRAHGDRIDLYQVDSARVARLILDGKLKGTIDKTENDLHVYVRGDRAQMLDAVRTLPLFETRATELQRRHQSVEQFEHDVIAAQSRQPQ